MLELLLGLLPEALYFSLFMIFTKKIKNKIIPFISLMVVEYILLFTFLRNTVFSHVLFFITTYCMLKTFYKEKCQITDVFTLSIASLIMIISSMILYFIIWKTINSYIVYVILHRVVLFIILMLLKNKLPKLQLLYNALWNKSETKKKMKSTTFRSLNLVIFNIVFYIINLGILFAMYTRR